MGIPCVAVDDLCVDGGGVEIQAALERTENGLELRRAGVVRGVQTEAARGEISDGGILVAEAADLDRHELGEFAAEVFDMHAGAAVDVRRVFVREEEGFHAAKAT